MRFVGAPFTFSFNMLADNISVISPNAVTSIGDRIFWMDSENFFVYSGRIQAIPCTVLRYVFDDIEMDESLKFFAAPNRMFDEVFWFYVTSGNTDIDRYVKFNYAENTWDIGSLSRTAWLDFGVQDKPRAAGTISDTTYVYNHELGTDNDGSAMSSYVETAVFDIGDGQQFSFIKRIIPDIAITSASGSSVNYVLKTRNFPGESLSTNSTNEVTSTTKQNFVRSRSRSAALRIESSAEDISWTLGDVRLDIQPDGRR